AQVLLAVIASMYAVYHGPEGLQRIADDVRRRTVRLAESLRTGGVSLLHDAHFDTLAARVPGRADAVIASALDRHVNLRRIDGDTVGIALDETTTDDVLREVAGAFGVSSVDGGPS